ncbi:hypothetical protein AMK23_30060 [Streptomyces sp. CB02130]|nr:hypothetical protein AMK23_30060 [Streptomyces sp. CB02130]
MFPQMAVERKEQVEALFVREARRRYVSGAIAGRCCRLRARTLEALTAMQGDKRPLRPRKPQLRPEIGAMADF